MHRLVSSCSVAITSRLYIANHKIDYYNYHSTELVAEDPTEVVSKFH